MRINPRDVAVTAKTLAVATLGGWLFATLKLPAPWFSGPMLTVAAMSMTGREVMLPNLLRDLGLLIAGVAMGSLVAPEALEILARYPASLAGLAASMIAGVYLSKVLLERLYGWDRQTAIFSSIPGALTVVMLMAAQSNADLRRIAVVQSFRLFVLVAIMPIAVTSTTIITQRPEQAGMSALAMASLFAAAFALYATFAAFQAINSLFLGAIVSATLLHLTNILPGPLPEPVAILGFILCGVYSGSRFEGLTMRMLSGMIGPAAVSFLATMVAAVACGALVVMVTGLRIADVLVAFAPGAFEAMILVGAALGLDTLYISTHHVARMLAVNTLLPLFPPKSLPGTTNG